MKRKRGSKTDGERKGGGPSMFGGGPHTQAWLPTSTGERTQGSRKRQTEKGFREAKIVRRRKVPIPRRPNLELGTREGMGEENEGCGPTDRSSPGDLIKRDLRRGK